MEPDIAFFLKKIVWSLSAALVWMLVNTLFGIRFRYFLFEEGHTIGSSIFYGWLVVSVFLMLRLYRKWWRHRERLVR
jgi:hypothetical protein